MLSNSLKIRFYNLLKNNKRTIIYIPLLVYWLTLFILTSIPTDSLPRLFGLSDKIEHFGAYLGLSFLVTLMLFFQRRSKLMTRYYLLAGVFIATFYGVFDEIHQYFIPGRYCEIWDFIANLLGSVIGALLAYQLLKYLTIKQNLK